MFSWPRFKIAINVIFDFTYYDHRANKNAFMSKYISPNLKTSYGDNTIHYNITFIID